MYIHAVTTKKHTKKKKKKKTPNIRITFPIFSTPSGLTEENDKPIQHLKVHHSHCQKAPSWSSLATLPTSTSIQGTLQEHKPESRQNSREILKTEEEEEDKD